MPRLALLLVALSLGCGRGERPTDAPPAEPRELTNLRAFARLYGVVRFFHPSDEAAAIDWNRYAVLGVHRVRGARDAAALEAALDTLVAPIAPTVQILHPGEAAAEIAAPAGGDLDVVAWQHEGPGLEDSAVPYVSKRTGRSMAVAAEGSAGWTAVSQAIEATAYRGKPFRLRARVKASPNVKASAWARVDRTGGAAGFFDNMGNRMIDAPEWTEAVIEGTIDADAAQLVLGGLVTGGGEAWFDDFELTIGGAAVALANPRFTDGTEGWGGGIAKGNRRGETGYTFAAEKGALHVAPSGGTVRSVDLFTERPRAGEIADVNLGGGLRARVPIALWSRDGHTLPAAEPAPLVAALAALHPALEDADSRLADLVVAWSVLDQFYPYFDVAAPDWPGALDRALLDGLDDAGAADHARTLGRLIAALEDGHGAVLVATGEEASLPLRLGWVEDRMVVLVSSVSELARGDVIEAIDGVPAADALAAEVALRSGSPQWRRVTALTLVGRGPPGSSARLRVAGKRDVTVARGAAPPVQFAHPALAELDGGIWYVDLARTNTADIAAKTETLAGAPGIVFDLRGYPNGTHAVLSNLLPAPEQDRWMHVPRIIRPALPGAPRPAPTWNSVGWDLGPAERRFTGTVVFLTGSGAISYAESVMGYVEALGLPIVGEPTAGTNGNIRRVLLPTRSSFIFTGMKVTRHDGTRSHLQGIRPTIPARPTIAGVRAGRDEVLERALELVRTKPRSP